MMSTSKECVILDMEDGRWFYLLESAFRDKLGVEWMDEHNAYGPFAGRDEAVEHLRVERAIPGGYWFEAVSDLHGYRRRAVLYAIEHADVPATDWSRRG